MASSANDDAAVTITVDDGGYDMSALYADAMGKVKPQLERLPQVASLIGSAQSLSDYSSGARGGRVGNRRSTTLQLTRRTSKPGEENC